MALTVEFDAKNNTLREMLEGRTTGATFCSISTQEQRGIWPPARRALAFWTSRRLPAVEVSSAAIRRVAASPPVFPAGMRVLVIPRDFIYGLACMFQILTEGTRPESRGARTMEGAYRLLEVNSPEFEPVRDIEST